MKSANTSIVLAAMLLMFAPSAQKEQRVQSKLLDVV